MARRSRSFSQRVKDQVAFSLVAVLVLIFALRLLGIRSTFASIFLSVVLTIGLNVGLSFLGDVRARRDARDARDARAAREPGRTGRGGDDRSYRHPRPADGDIRFREERRR